jgi:hypothetical protein
MQLQDEDVGVDDDEDRVPLQTAGNGNKFLKQTTGNGNKLLEQTAGNGNQLFNKIPRPSRLGFVLKILNYPSVEQKEFGENVRAPVGEISRADGVVEEVVAAVAVDGGRTHDRHFLGPMLCLC